MVNLKNALEKFKEDTGVDFFDLMADPEFRKRVFEEDEKVDRDEEEERREFEGFVKAMYGDVFRDDKDTRGE